MVWPISGMGWIMILISLLTSAFPVRRAGVTGSDTWWRSPWCDCKETPPRKQSLVLSWWGWRWLKQWCYVGLHFRGCESEGQCCGMKVLVYGWGELQPLSRGVFRFWSSLCSSGVTRGENSKNLRWELVTLEGDGQICLYYMSVLSTMEIIKTAE